ncbi:unnamed protein product [Blepharisma stoltei]|uniref:Uncharacterized protein n=1 Tax=Blepharisma stoltei TaxID=1481888 RepID=A0AAU9ITK7_9CILI|nr:unnamed protein product [Blepharisma stoltei]
MSRVNGGKLKMFAMNWTWVGEEKNSKNNRSKSMLALAEDKVKKLKREFEEIKDDDLIDDKKDIPLMKSDTSKLYESYMRKKIFERSMKRKGTLANLYGNKSEEKRKILRKYSSAWYLLPKNWKGQTLNGNEEGSKTERRFANENWNTQDRDTDQNSGSDFHERYRTAQTQIEKLETAKNYAKYLIAHKLQLPNYLKPVCQKYQLGSQNEKLPALSNVR